MQHYGVLGAAYGVPTITSLTSYKRYGVRAYAYENLGTTGATEKRGLWASAEDTADNNYGVYTEATGATNNYGLYVAGGTAMIKEQAAAEADVAGYGQIWVKTATPNELWFTDDAGTDVRLGTSTAANPDRGALYVDTTLTNTANGTPAKMLGAGSTTSVTLSNFDENGVENRLRYTGTETAWFEVSASLSCTHSVNSTIMTFSFAENGTNIANSSVDRKVGTGGDVGAFSMSWVIELDTNDYIEIFCDADNAGTSSITKGSFQITPL